MNKLLEVSLASSSSVTVFAETSEDATFDDFMMAEIVSQLEHKDYFHVHWMVADPDDYGIEIPAAATGFGSALVRTISSDTEASLVKLQEFDFDSLNDTYQHDYTVYETKLLEDQVFDQYQNLWVLFDETYGIQYDSITILEEYVFRGVEDFDNYLTAAKQISMYFEEALDFTEQQAATGYFMTDYELDKVLETVSDIISKTDDNELIIAFANAADQFSGLTEEQRTAYKEQDAKLIKNIVIPAYQEVYDRLIRLKGSRSKSGGLCEYEGGREYYQLLLQSRSSSTCSMEEMMVILETILKDTVVRQNNLSITYGEQAKDPQVPDMDDASETLDYLHSHLDELPACADVGYTVSYLDPTIANPNIIAYYMEPAVDDYADNVIKVNGANISDSADHYITLAHEGFPGHCYQITYYLATGANPLRGSFIPLGYCEGWAEYAQELALANSGLDQMSQEFYKCKESSYLKEPLLDIMLNGLGWTVDQAKKEFTSIGLDSSYVDGKIDVVLGEPTRLTPYGCGLARFRILRDKAESILGDDFDAAAYHEVLLKDGYRYFELVEQDVDNYIKANGGDPDSYAGYGANTVELTAGVSADSVCTDAEQPKVDYTHSYILIASMIAAGAVISLLLKKKHKSGSSQQ